jgi:PIN domain
MPVELDYGAICLDTCMFEQQGLALEKGYLAQLEQFVDTPVKVLQAEIVHFELEAHLTERIKEARLKVEKGLREAASHLGVEEDVIAQVKAQIVPAQTDLEVAQNRIHGFYERTQMEHTVSKFVKMEEIVEMYFKVKPPFEDNAKKKAEFPDAIALKSLEYWAEMNKTKVLVVSDDSGWEEYCATSNRLDCIKNLKAALVQFQPHTKAALIAEELEQLLGNDENSNQILLTFKNLIEYGVSNLKVHANVDSTYRTQEINMVTTYHGHIYDGEVQLVRVSKDQVVLSLGVLVDVEIVAEYGFLNRDFEMLSSTKLDDVREMRTDLLVTLVGDFSKGLAETILHKVEMIENSISIDFGEIEMDWETEGRYDF